MHRDGGRWWDVIGPQIERRVASEVGQMSDRLAHLLARTALEATAGRELLRSFAGAVMTDGNPANKEAAEQAVNQWRDRAWKRAAQDLRKPSAELRELIGLSTGGMRGGEESGDS